jgi:hypothetical protein
MNTKISERKFEDMEKSELLLLLKLFAIEVEKLQRENEQLDKSLRLADPDLYNICKGC